MPPIRRWRNPRGTTEEGYQRIRSKVTNAIEKQEEPAPCLYEDILDEEPVDTIQHALENIQLRNELANQADFKSHFAIGHALKRHMARQGSSTSTKAAEELGITNLQRRVGLSIHNVFRRYPQALNHMGNVTITEWRELSLDQIESINIHVAAKYPLSSIHDLWYDDVFLEL